MLKFFVSKSLVILDFRTNFQLSVTFLSSVLVCWNFRSVWTPPQDLIKINGCLFIKLPGYHCRSFIIHNKAHNKSCWGFIFYNWFIKIWNWVESSQKFIEKMVTENFLAIYFIFSNTLDNWVSRSSRKKKFEKWEKTGVLDFVFKVPDG